MLLAIINLIILAIGVIVIPFLIGKGKIRPGISPIERLKSEIILEMHKSLSQGNVYCHIYKLRDTIFQKSTRRKKKYPTLEYLLQFDQALRELDIERRILMVYQMEVDKEESVSYQSPYQRRIDQYGVVKEKTLIYAIIPTSDKREEILDERSRMRNFFRR